MNLVRCVALGTIVPASPQEVGGEIYVYHCERLIDVGPVAYAAFTEFARLLGLGYADVNTLTSQDEVLFAMLGDVVVAIICFQNDEEQAQFYISLSWTHEAFNAERCTYPHCQCPPIEGSPGPETRGPTH